MNEIQFLMYNPDEKMVISILENTTQYGTIDEFLKFNRYEILKGHGRISHNTAKEKAMGEYQEFNKNEKIVSDFDKGIRGIKGDSNGKKQQ
ncbi:RhuM family protein [Clostridium kluyveri]|uniref:RhuM family protein n=1 Tax=Clostridium kluyveri TaxID=1534 RepID=UPI0022480552|nr:RhuM family protein [Clostridium kluyveri]UZQ48952.1 virulence RhuM family protein [Clostridium kluyveri]